MARLPRTLSRSISSSVSRAALGLLQPQVYRAEEKKNATPEAKAKTRSKETKELPARACIVRLSLQTEQRASGNQQAGKEEAFLLVLNVFF